MAATDTQALEKRTSVITTPEAFDEAMKKWTGKFNVLTPFTAISGLAAQHGIIVSQVKINTDTSKTGPGEVYDGLPFLSRDEVALAKIGLRKLAECGAISTRTERTDPRTIAHYWEFRAIASYRGIDGAIVTREATAEWDLRDGSARLKGWTPNQITEGRKNGLRNAETRAINAAIRECGCGIKQKYTKTELEKPFLVLRVAFQPDMTDPEQRRMVAEHGLRSTSTLYGGGGRLLPANDAVDGEVLDEPRTVGSGKAADAPTTPDPEAPPTEDAVRIVKVAEKKGINEKTKRPWLRFDVIDHNGEVCSTFDTKLAEAAQKACDTKAWVELAIEQNGNYRNLIEIVPAGTNPALPGMENL